MIFIMTPQAFILLLFLSALSLLPFTTGTDHPPVCLPLDCKPIIESNRFRRNFTRSSLISSASRLQSFSLSTPNHHRVFGGKPHEAAIDWIITEAKKAGYFVWTEGFEGWYTAAGEQGLKGEIIGFGGKSLSLSLGAFKGARSTHGNVLSQVVLVDHYGCDLGDYKLGKEKIVLIKGLGNCTDIEKIQFAKTAGAIAALVYQDVPGGKAVTARINLNVREVNKEEDLPIPSAGLSFAQGTDIATILTSGANVTITLRLNLDYIAEIRQTYNIFAQTKDGDAGNVIMLGAHTDSDSEGPGMNDNGSGVISLIEILKQLSRYRVNNSVRFAFWSGGEYGLLGSKWYVKHLHPSERNAIKMYLNVDTIASHNYIYGTTAGGLPGSLAIGKLFEEYFTKEVKKPYVPIEVTNDKRDYSPFINAGIPIGDVYAGSSEIKTAEWTRLFGGEEGKRLDGGYYGDKDTVDHLNVEACLELTKAVAHVVALAAADLKFLG